MRMGKPQPRRGNDITQAYNDGFVRIYSTSDAAAPGRQPRIELTLKGALSFEERALGITRIYLSRQHQSEIERVIRVQRLSISPQDVAITHDGIAYRIDSVQAVMDVLPPSLDLALKKLEQRFEVMPG